MVSRDLQEYDVDVTMKGKFSVLARSAEEARRQIEDLEPEELKDRILMWLDADAEVCC